MPFREFFRGLMGIPPRTPDENNNRDVWSNDPFYDLFRDFSAMVDAQRAGQATEEEDRPESRQHSGGQDDFSFQIFPEPQDMFRHFEEQFMRTFQGFGMMEFPSRFGQPPLEAPLSPPTAPSGGDPTSLRDRMLKPGTSELPDGRRADTDLDDRVQESGLSALLEPPQSPSAGALVPSLSPSADDQPRLFSSARSFSVRRFVGPDGRVEERRTETGPDGQTRHTVTRRLGDQQQTLVTRQLPDGSSEQEEHLTNMDEGGLPAFDRLWQEPSSSPSNSAPRADSARLGESFWRGVFGW